MMDARWPAAALALTLGCGGRDAPEATPIAEWACEHATEGELIDAAEERAEASDIEVGRAPYRVNTRPEQAGYLGLTLAEGAQLVVVTDDPDAVAAVWDVAERTGIEAVVLEPGCADVDLFVAEITLLAGEHALEVGPTRQANVWLAVGPP